MDITKKDRNTVSKALTECGWDADIALASLLERGVIEAEEKTNSFVVSN